MYYIHYHAQLCNHLWAVGATTATDPLTPDILCGAGGGPSACLVSVGAWRATRFWTSDWEAATAAIRTAKNFMFLGFKINYNSCLEYMNMLYNN